MKYTKLGNSDLNVSRICLGCMGFGNASTGQHSWTVDEEQTRSIIKRALAGGRLAKHKGESSKRLVEDAYAKFKYDKTAEMDQVIIDRVAELAQKKNVSMTEISLAWLLTKVTAPVVGATKISQLEGMAKAVDLKLSDEEISYLEEMYLPHPLVGVMAQNGKQKDGNVV